MATTNPHELGSPADCDQRCDAVFPLPLTPFEYYYWCDDRPDYPTAFPVNIEFSGLLERTAFEAAVEEGLSRQLMLTARIDDAGKRPLWVAGGELPTVDWQDDSVPIRHPRGPRIDLHIEPGIRVFVRQGADHTRVRLHYHHACCDGLASIQFAEEVLLHYCRRIGTLAEPPRTIDGGQLRERTTFLEPSELPPPSLRFALRDAAVTASEFSKLLLRRPAVIAARDASTNGVQGTAPTDSEVMDLEFVTHFLNAEEARGLRKTAQSQGVSQNDLLLRDMFCTLARWNTERGRTKNEWLRILMPVDLRSRGDRTMPATNRMSFSFVTCATSECGRPNELLHNVGLETERIVRQKLGLYFLGGLGFAAGIPGAVPWALRRPMPFATVCLSNLGRVFGRTPLPRLEGKVVCGSAVMESLTGVPPIRPFTRAALAIFNYDQKLAISVRCDPKWFSTVETNQFLAAYVAQLQETIERGN